MALPIIKTGQFGATRSFTEAYADEFDTAGPGPGPNWMYDDMSRALNRAGNGDMDANGNPSNSSVDGKRWAAWYNGQNDDWVYRANGKLYVGGQLVNASDPTRENYTYNGVTYNWGNIRAYTAYMVQWHRIWDEGQGKQITDPASPNIYMSPGHYIEIKLSVEQMGIPGFRISAWLMPIIPNESKAYTGGAADGAEIDIFEIEHWAGGGYGNNRVQSKVLGGDGFKTIDQGGGNIDATAFNINSGYHTYGLLWLSSGLYWYIDGIESIRDEANMPLVNQFLSLTRELNAGVKDVEWAAPSDIPSNGIKRPVDVGIYNVSSYPFLSSIGQDRAAIEYIRVWSVDGEGGTFNGPNNTGGETGGGTPLPDPTIPTQPPLDAFIDVQPMAEFGNSFTARPRLKALEDGTPANPDDYTYSWTIADELVPVSDLDQYEVVLDLATAIDPGTEATYAMSVDIQSKAAPGPAPITIQYSPVEGEYGPAE